MQKVDRSESNIKGRRGMKGKLMASGAVCLPGNCDHPALISRGMRIVSKDGLVLGKVAAVVFDGATNEAHHILLTRLPEEHGYWTIPVKWITDVGAETIRLSVKEEEAYLFEWHSP